MKKSTLIIVAILLVVASAAPVMAKNNQTNGQDSVLSKAEVIKESDSGARSRGEGKGNEKAADKENIFTLNPNNSKNQKFDTAKLPLYLQGTITGIDTAAGTITVSLMQGNAQVKMYIGSELTLSASEDVDLFQVTQIDDDYDDMDNDEYRDMHDDDDEDMDDDGDDMHDADGEDMDDDDDEDMDDDDDEDMVDYDRNMEDSDDDMESMKEAITFDQLSVGQKVSIHGFVANDLFTATKITVYILMPSGEQMDD